MRRSRSIVLAVGLVAATLHVHPAGAVNRAQGAVVSPRPVAWTPQVLDGEVRSLAEAGGKIVVGGAFTQVRDAGQQAVSQRSDLFAFDAHTGAIDAGFVPALDGEVEALVPAADGRSVFVGGHFHHVNGAVAAGLVKLDLGSGQMVPGFQTAIGGSSPLVFTLALGPGRLFLGGTFDAVGGAPRSLLAAVDPNTGTVDQSVNIPFSGPRKGIARIDRLDVTPSGSRLVAIGNFTVVAGQDRTQIAMLDVSARPARLADWETDRFKDPCATGFDTCMRGMDISPDGSYFIVITTGAYRKGTLWDSVSRWEFGPAGPAQQPTWVDLDGGDSFTGVAVTGTAIYVAGHNRWMNNPHPNGTNVNALPGPGGVPREGIAALDPANGLPLSWNPGKTRGKGSRTLLATADGLWVGSDTEGFAGEYHARLAMCPLAGGAAPPAAMPGRLPGDLAILGLDGRLVRRSFDGSTAGAPVELNTAVDWSQARGAFMLSGKLYTGWSDGKLYVFSFNGTAVGGATPLELYGLPASEFPITQLSGMFFDRGRLYYTVAGDPRLYYRYFTPESGVVGAETFVASGRSDGFDWSRVAGITLISGRLYWSRPDGSLYRTDFTGGRPAGNSGAVSGPAAGRPWTSRGLFMVSP
jgi:hypothetical protein